MSSAPIPTPYTDYAQFPEAWRNAALSVLVDLGDLALAALVRQGADDGQMDVMRAALAAELAWHQRERTSSPRVPALQALLAAWTAWTASDPNADLASAPFAACEACWRFRAEALAASRALRAT